MVQSSKMPKKFNARPLRHRTSLKEFRHLKKIVLAALLGLTLLPAASNAQVIIKIGPPVAIVEHPGPVPHPGWIWTPGYHRWDGARYVWVPGRYQHPPRPGAVWVPHTYVQRGGGYVFVEGHWR
jgi:hypothetical protein